MVRKAQTNWTLQSKLDERKEVIPGDSGGDSASQTLIPPMKTQQRNQLGYITCDEQMGKREWSGL